MSKLIIIFLFNICCHAQQIAFPTAVGAGAYATGGRGGQVIKVTNLNDSGSGSLRSALLATYPRIIVFDVSGTIVLNSMIELGLENSNFTVAGQTAPEGGVTISGNPIKMGGGYVLPPQACNNAIWRYVRFRNGSYTGEPDVYEHNGFISNATTDLIFDHCSFSFCDDQAISMTADWAEITNVTIQNCIFSENATAIVAGNSLAHATGNMTFYNNLFVDQSHRLPNVVGNLQYDIINNVIFNYGSRATTISSSSPKVNYIGNMLIAGDNSLDEVANMVFSGEPLIYSNGNEHNVLSNNELWQGWYDYTALPDSYFAFLQFPLVGKPFEVTTANKAFNTVLNNVGANAYLNADGSRGDYLDSFDALKIDNVLNGISGNPDNKNWTLPNLPENQRPLNYDSNNDGMPDAWKLSKGFGVFEDLSSYKWASGYIGIEEFLNEVDSQDSTLSDNEFIRGVHYDEIRYFTMHGMELKSIENAASGLYIKVFYKDGIKIKSLKYPKL